MSDKMTKNVSQEDTFREMWKRMRMNHENLLGTSIRQTKEKMQKP